ncbi:uncharacterized protein DNG_02582 [Cephalotrichum gorgonifer]|uniref:FAD/NAD(P)-binding domain-containing protein n=1 Tax=Cephalotrichum gorgonifer TaxID=2041049 RepID=A0AAE8MUP1_9PEZI|nr:uncharacterized protein DNG_02582 [Cephalotrichum gorgonifer]
MVAPSRYLLAAVITATGALASNKGSPVCIVGAGPAGLSAAKALEDKGRDVVIFEKQATVGGKSQAVYKDDWFLPLGAVLFNEDSYVETVKLVEQTGVPYRNFSAGERWTFDWKSDDAEVIPGATEDFEQALVLEYLRYSEIWTTVYEPYSGIGYKNGVPAELAVPGAQWLAENGFQVIGIPMIDAFTSYGYGDYREIPILYMLQFFTPSILGNYLGITSGYILDFHTLFVEYSKLIKGPIYLEAEIKSINREKYPTISYRKKGSRRTYTQKCSDLVLAFPPTIKALEAANLDLTAEEEDLFGDVVVHNYFSSAVQMDQLPEDVSFWFEKPDPFTPVAPEGQPIYFQILHPGSGIASVYSWDRTDISPDPEKAKKLLIETLSKFNKDPRNAQQESVPVTEEDVLGWSGVVDYFPHLNTAALEAGWYDRFNKIQGKSRTYFASGLNGFEIVEFPLRAGKDIAESYL